MLLAVGPVTSDFCTCDKGIQRTLAKLWTHTETHGQDILSLFQNGDFILWLQRSDLPSWKGCGIQIQNGYKNKDGPIPFIPPFLCPSVSILWQPFFDWAAKPLETHYHGYLSTFLLLFMRHGKSALHDFCTLWNVLRYVCGRRHYSATVLFD